jgi:hypothetical protein
MSDVLIVGAGPAGLACALVVSCHAEVDSGTDTVRPDLEVVDPSGAWLTAWDRRFEAQAIPHLRSPAVHHPYPEPFALLEYARGQGLVPSGGTQLPTTACFSGFVQRTVRVTGLDRVVTPAGVTAMDLDARGRPAVELTDGSTRTPDRVVLATNVRRPVIPTGLGDAVADGRAVLGASADVADTPAGGRVTVIGGGLSAAHLALGAVERGAAVTLVARRRLAVRRFDTHPSWLGPKKRRPFEQETDPVVRRRIVDGARGGGSIPHRVRRRLDVAIRDGRLELRERITTVGTVPIGDAVRLCLDDGGHLDTDALWLATGGTVEVTSDPLFTALLARFPTPIAGGLPVLDPDLSWPGTRVHLAGFATALTLGPTAGNLIGQRRAASRIGAGLRGEDPARADRIITGAGACPSRHHPAQRTRRPVAARS